MTNQELINTYLRQDNFEKQPIHYVGTPYGCEVYKIVKNQDSVSEIHYPIAHGGTPIVLGDVTYDNGVTKITKIKICFVMGDSRKYVEVTSDELETKLFRDVPEFRPVPGGNNRAYCVDCVKQQLSGSLMTHETIYTRTGHLEKDGEHYFLLPGGVMDKNGFVEGFNVNLQSERLTRNYTPSKGKDPERYETLWDFFRIAPLRVMYLIFSVVFMSPLNGIFRNAGHEPAFVTYLAGKTNSFKSTLSALAMCFFGDSDYEHLPASSRISSAALYHIGQILSDVVFVADDFHPQETKYKKDAQAAIAQDIVRLWGNRDTTDRAKRSGDGLRPAAPVKGNIIVSGEYIPEIGQSGQARLMITEWSADEVDKSVLTKVQKNRHHLSQIFTDYVPWVLAHYDEFSESFEESFVNLRSKLNMQYGRTNEAVAHLQMTMSIFVKFMIETNRMTIDEGKEMLAESWNVFTELGTKQTEQIEHASPVSQFCEAFREMLITKRISLTDLKNPSSYIETEDSETPLIPYTGTKSNIGYKDDNFYYIRQAGLKTALIKFYQEQGTLPPFDLEPLLKQLLKERLIVTDGKLLTKKKVINGQGLRYIWLSIKAVDEYDEDCGKNDEE